MNEIIFDLQRFADDSTLTADEKEAIQRSSLPHLRMISNVAKNPIFTGFVNLLEQNKDSLEKIDKYVSPMFTLIGAFSKKKFGKDGLITLAQEATLFSSMVKIVDSILDVCDNLVGADADAVDKELGDIVTEISKMCGSISKLSDKNEDGILMPIVTASLSYGLAVMASIDNLKPDKQKAIDKALVKLGGATIKGFLKEIMQDSTAFTAPFGIADFGISVFVGILEGMSRNADKIDYYSDDGLPEDIVRKEAMMDAIASGLKETLHTYLKGTDDIASYAGQILAQGCKWLGHLFAGELDSYQFSMLEMNYMETIREIAKKGEYSSSSYSDIITVASSGTSVYAQDGNDYIENEFSNVTIFAGHGNDMVSSYGGAKYNSIHGGNGNDNLYITNSYSTIDGGKDNDFIFVYQGKNSINGNDGSDIILVRSEANTVIGGAGDDFFDLTDSTKTIIDYTQGDGQDVIYGYNTSHVIKIKGDYSTVISGEDVIIQVGDGGIIVDSAKDLKLNINTIELAEDESLPTYTNTLIKNPYDNAIILMPSFQGSKDVLRGTNNGDYIENTLSNIMIYGFNGNDTISNYGDNVTINAGAGNDHVENYGANVKINGGSGDDYIYSEGYETTISGGDGKDTIDNRGENSRIDGGDDMDSIKNSGEDTDINSGAGVDRIVNLASAVEIYSYLDDNYITNTEDDVTIEGSEDNDYIFNSGNSVSINAGDGNNSVSIDGSVGGYQTIEAGGGDDTVQVGDRDETEEKREGNYIEVSDGGNYINNSNVENSTINAGSGNDTIITGGGEGGDWGYSWTSHTSIVAGAGNNKITVNSSMTYGEIIAGTGNDFVSIVGNGNYNRILLNSGDDTVITGGNESTINVGAGKNFVTLNSGSSDNSIIAGSGNDSVLINNSGGSNKISLGAGNNTVKSAKGRENVYTGDGDDKITVEGGYISVGGGKNNVSLNSGDTEIIAGAGDDTINVADIGEQRYYNKINVGDGNNYINNSNVELSTIGAGSGNDTIITGGGEGGDWGYSWTSHTSIVAGAGNNKISVNSGITYGKITAGKGNDFVSLGGDGSDNIISVGNGRNTIFTNHYYDTNYNTYNTIEAGTGSDLIYTSGNYSFINAGSGRNLVSLAGGKNNTIVTGKGNDTITLAADANNNVIIFGGGNDLVCNYHDGDTVFATGALTKRTSGTNIILTDGTSKMTLKGAKGKTINTATLSSNGEIYKMLVADKTAGDTVLPITIIPNPKTSPADIFNEKNSTLITGTAYDDTIDNVGTKITINALGGNDTISNEGNNSSINAGAGADTVDNHGVKVTILGGAGKDDVKNYGKQVLINGGADNDSVDNRGAKVTIVGDKGNDIIRNWDGDNGYGSEVSINGGAGNDFIWNNAGDYVTITAGSGNDSIINSGANVVFNYAKGDGNDTIKGFNATSILSITGSAYSTAKSGSDIVVTVGSNKITLAGAGTLSKANIVDATNLILNDKSSAAVTLASAVKTGDASKRTKAIKIIGNALANILNGGASNDTLSGAAGNDKLFGNVGNDSLVGGDGADTLSGGEGNDKLFGNAGNDSIAGGDGHDSINGGADNDKLFGNAGNDSLVGGDGADTLSGSTGDDKLYGDKGNDSLVGGSGDDYLNGGDGADKLFGESGDDKLYGGAGNDNLSGGTGSDTLSGGSGNDTLTGGKGHDLFIYSAGNDVIADFVAGDKISIGAAISGTSLKGSDATFTINKNTLTVKNGKGKEVTVINAKGKEQTLIGGALIISKNSTLESWREIADASTATSKVKLTGNAKNNTLFGSSKDDTLIGAAGADKLYGGKGNDSLNGGEGNDSLWGGVNSDTLIGGAGDDTITGSKNAEVILMGSSDGNDLVTNFGVKDTLKATDGTLKSKVSGSNYILTISDDDNTAKVTLKGAASLKTLNILGEEIVPSIIFTNANSSKQTLPADFVLADASARSKAIRIVGNALDNSIIGGKGKDTLYGKAGNDTLTGGKGNDLFVYEAGNDVITDMSANDTLQIGDGTGTYSKATDGDDIIVTVGDGKITLTGVADLNTLNILGKENSPGETYDDSSAAKVTLGSSIVIGDASARTTAIRIMGNTLDNTILGGAGKDKRPQIFHTLCAAVECVGQLVGYSLRVAAPHGFSRDRKGCDIIRKDPDGITREHGKDRGGQELVDGFDIRVKLLHAHRFAFLIGVVVKRGHDQLSDLDRKSVV